MAKFAVCLPIVAITFENIEKQKAVERLKESGERFGKGMVKKPDLLKNKGQSRC